MRCCARLQLSYRSERYCSQVCSNAASHSRWVARGRRASDPQLISCIGCAALFVRFNPARVYCSRLCSARLRMRKLPKTEARRLRHREVSREWAGRNRDPERERAWARAHPEYLRKRRIARRARERCAAGSWTMDQWNALVAAYGAKCAYCCTERALTVDHRVPLSRGGSNGIYNLLPACLDCNRAKGCRSEVEFRVNVERNGGRRRLSPRMEVGVASGQGASVSSDDLVRGRGQVIERAWRREIASVQAATELGISRSHFLLLSARYRAFGADGLGPKPRRRERPDIRLPSTAVSEILALAEALPRLGPRALAQHLRQQASGDRYVSQSSVWNVLKRAGLNRRATRIAAAESRAGVSTAKSLPMLPMLDGRPTVSPPSPGRRWR